MKKYIIFLLAALLTLTYCQKNRELNPGDNTESRDPSAGPQDPSAGPEDPSGSPSDYTPPTIPEDQVSEDPDFEVPDEGVMKKVDMGMAVKWASCNLGATSAEDPGAFFAWGETTVKDYYSMATYKWGCEVQANNTWFNILKYNTDWIVGDIDFNTVLDPEDDPATATLGEGWRLPTREEMETLLGSGYTWTPRDGGYEVKCSSTGGTIFFPGGGVNYNDENSEDGDISYWTSTLDAESGQNVACCLTRSYEGNIEVMPGARQLGMNVRPVYGPAAKEPDHVVATLYSDGISPSGAQLSGCLYPLTSFSGIEAGIVVSTSFINEPTLENGTKYKATSLDSDSRFTVSATGLDNNTEYHYRAYAKNGDDVEYGVVQWFKTGSIKVCAMAPEDVSEYKATITGRLSAANYESLNIKAYFLYSSEANNKDDLIDRGSKRDATTEKLNSGAASFKCSLTGLGYGKTYYYLLCVEAGGVKYYSEPRSFKTRTADVSFMMEANKIAETTVEISGKITVDTQATVSKEFWLNYKMDESLSAPEKVRIDPDESGKFTVRLHGLKWNTRYFLTLSGTVQGINYESAVESITTKDFKLRGVDLGLSIKIDWANINLGAKKPLDAGDLYCWGMVEDIYDLSNWHPDLLPEDFPGYENDLLDHKIAHYNEMADYTGLRDWIIKQGNKVLGETWDVAAVKLGGTWRMPTYDDFTALFAECDIYDYPYGDAVEVVSKANGNAILIPKSSSDLETFYWTACVRRDDPVNIANRLSWIIKGPDNIKWYNVFGYKTLRIRPVRVR